MLTHLPFRHYRTEGLHDGSTCARWLANGDTAHFRGYGPWYLLARTLHQMRRNRAAFALVYGYVSAAVRRAPGMEDPEARAILRTDQSVQNIVHGRREAFGLSDAPKNCAVRR
jgi:hypothetical protein